MQKKIKIYNLDINYDVNYRHVQYPRLEFKTGRLLLILPRNYKNERKIIETHKNWIYKKHKEIVDSLRASKNKELNTETTQEEFRSIVHSTMNKYLGKLDLNVNKVCFKQMKSKWASCSSSSNLMINSLLRYLPKSLIEYVIYHEIIHLKERKHNERFWKLVGVKYREYQRKEKELFQYWFLVQSKIKQASSSPQNSA